MSNIKFFIIISIIQLRENPSIFTEVRAWTDGQKRRMYKHFKLCRKVLKIMGQNALNIS